MQFKVSKERFGYEKFSARMKKTSMTMIEGKESSKKIGRRQAMTVNKFDIQIEDKMIFVSE
jgi:hypothetical protein